MEGQNTSQDGSARPTKRAKRVKPEEEEDEHGIPAEMKDFIVPDDADTVTTATTVAAEEEEDTNELMQEAARVAQGAAGLIVNEQGLRRSARANKGKPPAPFIQEGYAELMLDDADVDDVFNDSADDASIHTSDEEEEEVDNEKEGNDKEEEEEEEEDDKDDAQNEDEDEDYTESEEEEEEDDSEEEEEDEESEEDDNVIVKL